eukprot:TRINITY_DN2415_c0_g1_i2.p1 TRINITY_DN2415_c0_g1~~TRINITY_DN2415_c0_g1_i2.p1  ORF type:complete len:472 (-),score=51.50 TRINITY_DN2415_c0_g1_i2:264-1652(-)
MTQPLYAVHWKSTHQEFRRPELEALCQLHGDAISFRDDLNSDPTSPFDFFHAEGEDVVRRMASRAITVAAFCEVWGTCLTGDWDALAQSVQAHVEKTSPVSLKTARDEKLSYYLKYISYGRKTRTAFKEEMAAKLSFLAFTGREELHPQFSLYIASDWSPLAKPPPTKPVRAFIGPLICEAQRSLVDLYSLKKREFLGTTSMDSELALISVNTCQVKSGGLVFDPFVGTGSFLISAAAFGAYTLGGDIDIRVLKGRADDVGLGTNFEQYGLSHLHQGVVRFDMSKNDLFRDHSLFDAIITDPPYGVRAGARKVYMSKEVTPQKQNEAEGRPNPHYAQTVPYSVPDVLCDLIEFSARTLVHGGHLSYWLPTTPGYTDADLPTHPCLEVVSNSEQPLNKRWSRRLITMKKISAFIPGEHEGIVVRFHLAVLLPTLSLYHELCADSSTSHTIPKRSLATRLFLPR